MIATSMMQQILSDIGLSPIMGGSLAVIPNEALSCRVGGTSQIVKKYLKVARATFEIGCLQKIWDAPKSIRIPPEP